MDQILREATEKNLYNLVTEVKKDMDALEIPYDDKVPFKFNTRAKRFNAVCRLKYDEYFNKYAYLIEINRTYFIMQNLKGLKSTIAHELIHSAFPSDGHLGSWKEYAQKMTLNSNKKYEITRCTARTYNEPEPEYKYIVYCPDCGREWHYKIKCKGVKNVNNYICSGCKTHLQVKEFSK